MIAGRCEVGIAHFKTKAIARFADRKGLETAALRETVPRTLLEFASSA